MAPSRREGSQGLWLLLGSQLPYMLFVNQQPLPFSSPWSTITPPYWTLPSFGSQVFSFRRSEVKYMTGWGRELVDRSKQGPPGWESCYLLFLKMYCWYTSNLCLPKRSTPPLTPLEGDSNPILGPSWVSENSSAPREKARRKNVVKFTVELQTERL